MDVLSTLVTSNYYLLILLVFFILLPKHTVLYRYAFNVLFVLDCLANTALLLGDHREAISSRVGKAHLAGVTWVLPFMLFINLLFWPLEGDFNHCVKAIQHGVGDKAIWHWK
jgi:hypothetical protein